MLSVVSTAPGRKVKAAIKVLEIATTHPSTTFL